MHLTDIVIKNLKAPEKGQKDYRDDSLPGFMCRVSQAGARTFYLMHGADRRRTALGKYPDVTLKMARSEAQRLLAEHTLGKHQAPRQTFLAALEAFLAFHAANNRASTTSEVRRILTKQFASLHRKQLADVTMHDITRITDRMIVGGYPSAATHAHMAVRNFLSWCARRRFLDRSPLEGLERPSKSTSRERVLSDDELRAVWKAADDCGQFGKIVKLLIATGQRRSEIGSMQFEWLDLENGTCTIPASVTKNRRPHTFPVGRGLLELRSPRLPGSGPYVFSARGSDGGKPFNSWSKAKASLDRKVAEHLGANTKLIPWTLHDLRRTYATNLQRLGIKLEVIEALLNHVSGTRAGIVGVYQKHRYEAEMREAVGTFERWFTLQINSG
jgi:integrase